MDLSQYYRSLTSSILLPDNLSDIEKQVWGSAIVGQSDVIIQLVNDENVKTVRQQLKDLGLINIRVKEELEHAYVPGRHKYISAVKAHFPDIDDLDVNHALFATYLKSIKQAIARAENLNPIEKVCCKTLNEVYDQIKRTTNKWITVPYNVKTWDIIRNELLKVTSLKLKIITIQDCCGTEQLILIWNWDGQHPQLLKEDIPKSFESVCGEFLYCE